MFPLPDLPYAYDALQPAMSDRTLHFHHDKHHAGYVKKLNALMEKSGERAGSLEEVVRKAAAKGKDGAALFNNAAQAWNHAFFWECMSPRKTEPSGRLADAIGEAYGSIGKLGETFAADGTAHFGSGWVWLTSDKGGKVSIETTHDARDLLSEPEHAPLLVCDLWEHAYYLDRQSDREGFLKTWIADLANWDFAGRQYEAARGGGQAWRYPAAMAHAA
jgi:Fe-Mn family superoxide dismutase